MKKSIGKYWIQYFFSRIFNTLERKKYWIQYSPILFFHTGFLHIFMLLITESRSFDKKESYPAFPDLKID